MNTGFYKDLDTNFEQAFDMIQKEFTHQELLEMLQNGNIPQKQFAALEITQINSIEEAQILVNNLTGCDGKIREAVALKINQLLHKNPTLQTFFSQAETFADASIDINGNICRLVIDSVSILKENQDFSKIYLDKICQFIKTTFEELDKFIFRDKKYVINKQLFKLYWCLESLKLFIKDIDKTLLLEILTKASKEKEYTIREKVAQILILLDSSEFNSLKNILKNDENYYVKTVFNG